VHTTRTPTHVACSNVFDQDTFGHTATLGQELHVKVMNGTVSAFEGLRLCRGCGTRLAAPLQQQSARIPRRAGASRLAVHARTAEVGVGMFGTKAGMTQIFTADGLAVPATVIALEDGNIVTQVKTPETDGYNAVQVRAWPTRGTVLPCSRPPFPPPTVASTPPASTVIND